VSETPSAIELRAPRGARVMEIDWSDGATSRFPHLVLRAFCPCAHCQGHQGPIAWHEVPSGDERALEILAIEEVGSYALRFSWGDGHSTGIYTFRYLRQLATISERPIEEVRGLTFGR
jgi:DUF971 family protein